MYILHVMFISSITSNIAYETVHTYTLLIYIMDIRYIWVCIYVTVCIHRRGGVIRFRNVFPSKARAISETERWSSA